MRTLDFYLPNTIINKENILQVDDDNSLSKIFNNYFSGPYLFHVTTETRYRMIKQVPQEYSRQTKQKLEKSIKFYKKCITEFQYDSREYNISNIKIKKWQPQELINKWNECNIIFITGSIGCGKSTYTEKIRHIIRENANKNEVKYNKVVLDFNVNNFVPHGVNINVFEDINSMNNTLVDNFKVKMRSQLKKDISGNSIDSIIKSISHIFRGEITLVFDALDKIYDTANRHILECKNGQHSANPIAQFVHDIILSSIKESNDDTQFKLIFCARPSTFKNIMIYKYVENQPRFLDQCNPYVIAIQSDVSQINRVVEGRFKCNDNNNKLNYSANLKNNLKHLIYYSSRYNLHGLRHLMSSIQSFVSVPQETTYYKWIFDIFCMLDDKKTYGQNRSNVYNIFLINSKYQKDVYRTSTNELDFVPVEYHKKHHHSYWLKYFILTKVYNGQYKSRGVEFAAIPEMENTFGKFEEHIYKLCVYSLSEVKNGRLLSCEYQGDDVTYFSTERLHKIFQNKITQKKDLTGEHIEFFSFTYLALVADDYYMLYPEILNQYLTGNFIYKNIFSQKDDYWCEWLKISVKKVFLFLLIIECSLTYYEKHFFKDTFYDKNKPDFNIIKTRVSDQIKNIGEDLSMDSYDVEEIINENNELVNNLRQEVIVFFKSLKEEVF